MCSTTAFSSACSSEAQKTHKCGDTQCTSILRRTFSLAYTNSSSEGHVYRWLHALVHTFFKNKPFQCLFRVSNTPSNPAMCFTESDQIIRIKGTLNSNAPSCLSTPGLGVNPYPDITTHPERAATKGTTPLPNGNACEVCSAGQTPVQVFTRSTTVSLDSETHLRDPCQMSCLKRVRCIC